jgi:putative ABC transport system substrate-binding protein
MGGAALAWPLAALAQQPAMPFIGFLSTGSPNERAHMVESFRKGLKEGGYVDGKDVAIEYRWAEGRAERLPQLAAELVNRKVAVIATSGGAQSALAAKSATSTIPIVFNSALDPVKLGLVASLSRPGGNITGVANVSGALEVKRLEMLRELVPTATRITYLVNPTDPGTKTFLNDVQSAAQKTAIRVRVVNASSEAEIDTAFAAIKQSRADALLVAGNALFTTRRDQLVALATRYAIPASYSRREFVVAGGLTSYGPDYMDAYRLQGLYTARVLKGAKPADLPVSQSTKFELVLNLKTARKLGLAVPRDFLQRVDEVIE